LRRCIRPRRRPGRRLRKFEENVELVEQKGKIANENGTKKKTHKAPNGEKMVVAKAFSSIIKGVKDLRHSTQTTLEPLF
jgi:hypothetical protein